MVRRVAVTSAARYAATLLIFAADESPLGGVSIFVRRAFTLVVMKASVLAERAPSTFSMRRRASSRAKMESPNGSSPFRSA